MGSQLIPGQPANRLSLQQIPAAVRLVETTEEIHQGGFTRAGRPHYRDKFAFLYVERNIAQGMDNVFSHHEALIHLFEQDTLHIDLPVQLSGGAGKSERIVFFCSLPLFSPEITIIPSLILVVSFTSVIWSLLRPVPTATRLGFPLSFRM